jgi:hypothetical protein
MDGMEFGRFSTLQIPDRIAWDVYPEIDMKFSTSFLDLENIRVCGWNMMSWTALYPCTLSPADIF